jgi:Zn-dependent peptidase ImmA (M78 family)
MVHLLESRGVRVASLATEYHDIDAFCFVRDGTAYAFLNTSKSAERQRFDAAHELGHLVLHRGQDMDITESRVREIEANRFASAFLMPQSGVLRQAMYGASLERVLKARSHWKVAAMAMTYRLHELRLLSDWQYRSLCIELSDKGFRSGEPGGIIPETSSLLRQTIYGRERRVGISQAAEALALYPDEVRAYVQRLVPMMA